MTAQRLTDRQAEMLGYLAEGLTYREIAERCVVSEGTVLITLRQVYQRLEAKNGANAVAIALGLNKGFRDEIDPALRPCPVWPRTKQALQLAANDLSQKQIAEAMGVGVKTIKTLIGRAHEVLACHSTTAAVARGIREGWLE